MTEKELVGIWAVDPVSDTRLDAFLYHYREHGAEVGAVDGHQYFQKAGEFNLKKHGRSRPVSGRTLGVRRWVKAGRYMDVTPENEIVSLGATAGREDE